MPFSNSALNFGSQKGHYSRYYCNMEKETFRKPCLEMPSLQTNRRMTVAFGRIVFFISVLKIVIFAHCAVSTCTRSMQPHSSPVKGLKNARASPLCCNVRHEICRHSIIHHDLAALWNESLSQSNLESRVFAMNTLKYCH